MKVQARLNNYRRSDKKVREIAPLIKGMNVKQAEMRLGSLRKGSSLDVLKLLQSAVANAKNNLGLKEEDLIITDLIAQQGKTLKRWRARAYGRAAQIKKRTCHVILTLEDLGASEKNNKTEKEEMKEDKKAGAVKDQSGKKDKKTAEKQEKADSQDKKSLERDSLDFRENKGKQGKIRDNGGKGGNKVFRRKSF